MVSVTRVSTRFSLGVENEGADAARDGRTCFTGRNSQARTSVENFFLAEIGSHTGAPPSIGLCKNHTTLYNTRLHMRK